MNETVKTAAIFLFRIGGSAFILLFCGIGNVVAFNAITALWGKLYP